jgi:CTP:phosphocholine cytidylyltransferase-like protein
MDTKQLIKDAKARFDFNSQKQELKDKYEAKLIFADQGGLWTANSYLFSLLHFLTDDYIIIIDNYGNPIQVNRSTLFTKASTIYQTVMQQWHLELQTISEFK